MVETNIDFTKTMKIKKHDNIFVSVRGPNLINTKKCSTIRNYLQPTISSLHLFTFQTPIFMVLKK